MADRQTSATNLTGWQLAVQVRAANVPADAPVALRQSLSPLVLEGRRARYVGNLLRRTGRRRDDGVTDPEEILAAYQVLHERGELLGEELR